MSCLCSRENGLASLPLPHHYHGGQPAGEGQGQHPHGQIAEISGLRRLARLLGGGRCRCGGGSRSGLGGVGVSGSAGGAHAVDIVVCQLGDGFALLQHGATVLAHLVSGVAFGGTGGLFGVLQLGFAVALGGKDGVLQGDLLGQGFVVEVEAADRTVPVLLVARFGTSGGLGLHLGGGVAQGAVRLLPGVGGVAAVALGGLGAVLGAGGVVVVLVVGEAVAQSGYFLGVGGGVTELAVDGLAARLGTGGGHVHGVGVLPDVVVGVQFAIGPAAVVTHGLVVAGGGAAGMDVGTHPDGGSVGQKLEGLGVQLHGGVIGRTGEVGVIRLHFQQGPAGGVEAQGGPICQAHPALGGEIACLGALDDEGGGGIHGQADGGNGVGSFQTDGESLVELAHGNGAVLLGLVQRGTVQGQGVGGGVIGDGTIPQHIRGVVTGDLGAANPHVVGVCQGDGDQSAGVVGELGVVVGPAVVLLVEDIEGLPGQVQAGEVQIYRPAGAVGGAVQVEHAAIVGVVAVCVGNHHREILVGSGDGVVIGDGEGVPLFGGGLGGEAAAGIVQQGQLPLVARIGGNGGNGALGHLAAHGGGGEEHGVGVQVEGGTCHVIRAHPLIVGEAAAVDVPDAVGGIGSGGAQPPQTVAVGVFGHPGGVVDKAIGGGLRLLGGEEEHLVPVQDVFHRIKGGLECCGDAVIGVVALGGSQHSPLLSGGEVVGVEGGTPGLGVAALPVLGQGAGGVKINAAPVARAQTDLGEDKQALFSGVGLVIQDPPLNGGVLPLAVIEVVVAVLAVVAGNATGAG